MPNHIAAYTPILGANFRAIGLTVATIVLLGFVAAWIRNIIVSRRELGSEIELAPNRKEYLSDEDLEGPKLDKSLSFALVLLTLLALILPFYWIAEPGRQEGAVAAYNRSFESRGSDTYIEGAQCVNCHAGGGVGGTAPFVLQDADGQFIANAAWQAPALDNVLLRYSEDEVRYILNYGRPGSPMAAWGTAGGGPLTTQQVDNVIVYLRTLQQQSLDPIVIASAGDPNDAQDAESQEALAAAGAIREDIVAEVERSIADGEFETVGEAVFNMGLNSGFAAGAYSCGRCHTRGWSLGTDVFPDIVDEGVAGCGGGNPSGIGYNLCNGSTKARFPDDSWVLPDGSWYELANFDESTQPEAVRGNPVDYDGTYVLAADGSKVSLDDQGEAVDGSGVPYLILGPGPDGDEDRNGDLASCDYVSQLWESESDGIYPIDPDIEFELDENGAFVDPEPLTPADLDGDVVTLDSGALASGCEIIDMPPRTSQAHYDFIYSGAEAGSGYGRGGMSGAGMMPSFGETLPPEYIQAVVDYERGL